MPACSRLDSNGNLRIDASCNTYTELEEGRKKICFVGENWISKTKKKPQKIKGLFFSASSKIKYTAADIWLHSEYIRGRKKNVRVCVFARSYLLLWTFAACGRVCFWTRVAVGHRWRRWVWNHSRSALCRKKQLQQWRGLAQPLLTFPITVSPTLIADLLLLCPFGPPSAFFVPVCSCA